MARVDITLNGRPYMVACEDGQEPRLHELARYVDGKFRAVSARAGAANDAQLLVLTALMLADELFDLRAEHLALAHRAGGAPADDGRMAEALDQLAKRIEDIAGRLEHT